MGVTMLETEPDASLWETFAHKWRMFNLVREVNGLGAALCEGAYQCCKPLVYAYTKLAWWQYRRRGLPPYRFSATNSPCIPTIKASRSNWPSIVFMNHARHACSPVASDRE